MGEEREIAVGLTIDDKDYFVNPAEVERIDKIRWGESMRNFQDPWKMLELPVRTLAYIGEADPVSVVWKASFSGTLNFHYFPAG